MREAINNNPMVQVAVIGVLVLVVGLFMMMNMKKGSSSSSSSPAPAASAPTTSAGSVPSTSATGVPGSTAAPSTGVTAPPVAGGTVSPAALLPGPGLPRPVVAAWKSGDAIVLLIVRGSGIDDRLVRSSVASLSGDAGLAVFITHAKDVARYSRITQGVGVDRVPALVVIHPRKLSGSVPQAEVSYGFRSAQSVVQAVHDALYTGRDDLTYSPR
jgi:Co/Zn/Cd efflux system component